jgi:hypothetical protein
MQGDIFADVPLPGFSESPHYAQIVMHPCNMRRGAVLRDRLTVIPVQEYSMRSSDWTKRFRIMPLPEMHGETSPNYMGDMTEFLTVDSSNLTPEKRAATLSDEGVLILQQRMVFTQTRLLLSLDNFHHQMAPTFIELELQEEWVEEALIHSAPDDDASVILNEAIKQYQAWLDEGGRRDAMKVVREHSRIRREARQHQMGLYD